MILPVYEQRYHVESRNHRNFFVSSSTTLLHIFWRIVFHAISLISILMSGILLCLNSLSTFLQTKGKYICHMKAFSPIVQYRIVSPIIIDI